jgi:hypothetical protein
VKVIKCLVNLFVEFQRKLKHLMIGLIILKSDYDISKPMNISSLRLNYLIMDNWVHCNWILRKLEESSRKI